MFFQSPDTIQINQSPRRERNFQRLGSLQTLEPGYPSPAEGQNQNCDCGRVPLALGFLLQLLDDRGVHRDESVLGLKRSARSLAVLGVETAEIEIFSEI